MIAASATSGRPDHDLSLTAGRLLARFRDASVRVHAITNAAAQTLTANLLLAAGGIPSLTTSAEEAPAFASRAGALLVNLGTLDAERRAAIPWAIAAARAQAKPWVLDPVFVEASPPRLDLARLCLTGGPAVLRCNRAEFQALSGSEAAPETLRSYARSIGSVVALTGSVDQVTDGHRLVAVENGHPLMARVTALGCAATALIAGFAAIEPDPLMAASAALLVIGVAGEVAGEAAQGPGSFQPALLDALYGLDEPTMAARGRVA